MRHDTNNIDGAGPFRLVNDASIDPGEVYRWPLNSREYRHNGRKGFFQDYLPLDSALMKNKDTNNPVVFRFNGTYEAEVEQAAADTFEQTPIARLQAENIGTGTINAEDLSIMLKKEPYTADDAARADAKRNPLEKIARNFIGL